MTDDRAYILMLDNRTLTLTLSHAPRLDLTKRYVIEMREWKPKRSLDQNAIWHAILGKIANVTGNDLQSVKDYVKENYGLKERIFDKLVTKPSHKYTTGEWPTLMEPTIALAGEYGVDIRDII
jgi:hypothetical protein